MAGARGGAREGAGRPSAAVKRTARSMKAFDDEWDIINQFSDLVKHWDKEKCQEFLTELQKKAGVSYNP